MNKSNLSISQLLDAAASIPARAKNSASKGKPSVGIVNSATNGKRLSFSKALVTTLELEDVAEIALIPSEGCILVAKKLPIENVLKCKFSPKDTGKKISYNTGAVEAITETFELNFSNHVSIS